MDINRKKRFIIGSTYYALIFAMIFIAYRFIMGYLWPFVIAFLSVFLLRKPAVILSKKSKIKVKYISIFLVVLSFLLLLLFLGFAAFILVKNIEKGNGITQLKNVVNGMSDGIESIILRLKKYLPESARNAVLTFFDVFPKKLGEWLSGAVTKTVSRLPRIFLGFAVTVAAGCYFSNEYEPLKNFFLSVVPEEKILLIKRVKAVAKENTFHIIKGYLFIAAVIFAVCFFVLLIIGSPHAFWLALLIALVDMLPVLGAGTVLVPWGIISAFSGNFFTPLMLFMCYLSTLAIHHIMEPKVLGKSVGVPPLITLIVMFTSLRIFGFFGMIIAVLTLVTVVNLYKAEEVSN